MSNNIVVSPRRHHRRDFLSIGAAAAAVIAGINAPAVVAAVAGPVPVSITASPIRRVIAEYQVAAEAHDKAMSAADEALYAAFPDPMTRLEEDRPAEVQQLYDEAERRYWIMNAAYDRVIATPCASLADCIAVLEWG